VLKSSNNVETQYLGLIDFDKALELQNQFHALVSLEKKSFILGLEHPLVMTLGLRAHKIDINSFCSKPWTAPVHKISRGGLATIHNPGQLVIYPLVDLRRQGLSVKQFVQLLFETTQKTLKELGIESTIDLCDQPGVYTSQGKIAFCGLQIKSGITLHGLSINIHNDVSVFGDIESCGVSASKIDSVQKHGVTYSTRDFFNIWLKHFNLEADLSLSNASCL
jgi:lipoate-protein ligase B